MLGSTISMSSVFNDVSNSVTSSVKYAVNGVSNGITGVTSSIRKIRIRKSVVIDTRYANGSGEWKAFTTAKKAEQFRVDYSMDEFDDENGTVKFIIPKNVSDISITWFTRVMYPSYYKLGEKALDKYDWLITKNDAAPDRVRVLKDKLHMGIQHCRELKEQGFNPDNWDELANAGKKYSFKTVGIGELIFDFSKQLTKGLRRRLRTLARETAYLCNRNLQTYMYCMYTVAFAVPFACALAFPGTYIGFYAAGITILALNFVELFRNIFSRL